MRGKTALWRCSLRGNRAKRELGCCVVARCDEPYANTPMVKLNDITMLADSLSRPAVAIEQVRCARVRNRNASCNRCVEICAAGALRLTGNELEYTAALCVNCGACASVCPNEVLTMLEPTKDTLAAHLEKMAQRFAHDDELAGRALVVVCARAAARARDCNELLIEVPCLGHIDTPLLLEIGAHHQPGVVLVDADCATCKLGWCSAHTDAVIADAQGLLSAATGKGVGVGVGVGEGAGVGAVVGEAGGEGISEAAGEAAGEADSEDQRFPARTSKLPSYALRAREDGDMQAARRHFLSSAADEVKQTVLTAARTTLNERFGTPSATTIEQLKLRENGTMLQFDMPRHLHALDALDAFCPSADAIFFSPLFAAVEIDVERCTSCGMCVTFCPTGALSRGENLPHTRTAARLDFLACECSACGLCADVCFKKCLTLRSDLAAGELFSLEPRTFKLGSASH